MNKKFKAFLVYLDDQDFGVYDVSEGVLPESDGPGKSRPGIVASTAEKMRKLTEPEIIAAMAHLRGVVTQIAADRTNRLSAQIKAARGKRSMN